MFAFIKIIYKFITKNSKVEIIKTSQKLTSNKARTTVPVQETGQSEKMNVAVDTLRRKKNEIFKNPVVKMIKNLTVFIDLNFITLIQLF